MTKTIVLVHGAWTTPSSWNLFRRRFESQGYRVITPAWPFIDRSVEEMRKKPDPRFAKVGLKQIVDHYDAVIRALPEPPILMGHSIGGLVVQLLADRGLGAAVVAIDPGAPAGVIPDPVAVINLLPVFTAFNGWNRALMMNLSHFRNAFANGLPRAEQEATWRAEIIPVPGRVFFHAALGINSGVTWRSRIRPPMLLIGGEKDRTAPAAMTRANFRAQRRAASPTAYKEFAGRSHFLCAEPGWEDVADYALAWARDYAVNPAAEPAPLRPFAVAA